MSNDDLIRAFERVAPLPDVYRGWRDQLAFYRKLADRMPDQRRSIETPEGWESGPRALIDDAIRDAEAAGESGDLDGFALHLQHAVEVLIHSDFGTVGELFRKKQSAAGGHRKRGHEGPLKQLLRIMIAETGQPEIGSIIDLWQRQPEIETDAFEIRLSFDEGDKKPYGAYWTLQDRLEMWTKRSIQEALKEIKRE